jgi:hypothetical protein
MYTDLFIVWFMTVSCHGLWCYLFCTSYK